MSAIGTKRTSACALHMSAFDPKRTSLPPDPFQNTGPDWYDAAVLSLGAESICGGGNFISFCLVGGAAWSAVRRLIALRLRSKPRSVPRRGRARCQRPPNPIRLPMRCGAACSASVTRRAATSRWKSATRRGAVIVPQSSPPSLFDSGVAVIVAHFTPAVRAAMAATKTIPIVMARRCASAIRVCQEFG